MGFRTKVKDALTIRSPLVRQGLAEFIGTFVLINFAIGCTAQSKLSREANGEFLSINFGARWGVALAIWVSGGVSGGHLNPAISVLMAVLGRLSILQMIVYMIAQYLGAFVGAASVYLVYLDAINNYDGGHHEVMGPNATAGIFATYPSPYVSTLEGFWDQVFGTMLLVLCVMAISDHYAATTDQGDMPFAIGGIVLAIGLSYGMNCGYPLNPARDFSLRLFTLAAGWGTGVFSAYDYWFWVPLVAPHIGAVLGGFLYQIMLGIHSEETESKTESEDQNTIKNIDKIIPIGS